MFGLVESTKDLLVGAGFFIALGSLVVGVFFTATRAAEGAKWAIAVMYSLAGVAVSIICLLMGAVLRGTL